MASTATQFRLIEALEDALEIANPVVIRDACRPMSYTVCPLTADCPPPFDWATVRASPAQNIIGEHMAPSGQPVPDVLIRRHDDYIQIVVETVIVDRRFMDALIDALDRAFPDVPSRSYRLLLEVGASETKLDLIAAFEVWRRAAEMAPEHVRIAYVVRDRPIHPIAKLIETVSKATHVRLRFFGDSEAALEWLLTDRAAS